jgi:hypothetical protein
MTSEHGEKVDHGPLLESMYTACSTHLTTGLACTLSITREYMEHGGRLPANCALTVYQRTWMYSIRIPGSRRVFVKTGQVHHFCMMRGICLLYRAVYQLPPPPDIVDSSRCTFLLGVYEYIVDNKVYNFKVSIVANFIRNNVNNNKVYL